MNKGSQRRLLATLSAMPHGVIKMSADIKSLVETSTTSRSSGRRRKRWNDHEPAELGGLRNQGDRTDGEAVLELGGPWSSRATVPGWKPNLDSPILALAKSTYQAMTGRSRQ